MDGGFVKTRPLRPPEAVRALGVMLGGSIALAAAAAASSVAVARAFMSERRPSPLALFGTAGTALYALVIRPWHLRWGAEPEDEKRPRPGDELLPKDGTQILHAVTIDAPVEDLWPWLAQLGQDRGGFYSYEWLENLAGCQMRNFSASVPRVSGTALSDSHTPKQQRDSLRDIAPSHRRSPPSRGAVGTGGRLRLTARGTRPVVEMVQIEGEVVIEATPAEVFDFVADERNLYDPRIRRAEKVSEGPITRRKADVAARPRRPARRSAPLGM
jgi:hypothetical protein